LAIFGVDALSMFPAIDYIVRADGTVSNPSNLLPLEAVYAMLIGLVSFVVIFFFFSLIFSLSRFMEPSQSPFCLLFSALEPFLADFHCLSSVHTFLAGHLIVKSDQIWAQLFAAGQCC
jgi:hypothetical protein